ncbi:MAG TPA: energy-coupling factor transporter transmembrane component T [Bacteroidales bacterium]|nr:energy-coupling factor transporter transmembrane component T [Bacteroidales bacterium]
MKNSIPPFMQKPDQDRHIDVQGAKLAFIDKTILDTAKAVKSIYLQAENADRNGFIQKVSPHVKLVSLIYMAVIISIVSNIYAQAAASLFIFILFLLSRLRITEVYRKILLLAFLFGFVVILPASLNIITKGDTLVNLIRLNKPVHFWIYNIPQNIGITDNGIQVVLLLFFRVLNSVSFALLIVYTTSFPAFIKTLKIIFVPDTFLMIMSLAYKYIFILSRTIEETYFALKSRLSGDIKSSNIRKLAGGRIFFIYKRSQMIYEGTYYAMISRGYNGSVKLTNRTNFVLRDIISLLIVLLMGVLIILI